MRTLQSILIVVPPKLAKNEMGLLIRNAMGFGRWWRCEVHFLTAPGDEQSIESAVTEFRRSNPDSPSALVIVPTADAKVERILETIQKYACDLVVLQDGAVVYQEEGTGARGILECTPSPILLLPKAFDFRATPPSSFLVPLSGEERFSESLSFSLKLASQSESPVDFLHVTTPNTLCTCDQSFEAIGDQLHHEYHEMIEKIAAEASPFSTPGERARVRHFHHCSGFTTAEILDALNGLPGAILMLEWKGTLGDGRAQTVKEILRETHNAALFVRAVHEQKSKLRVGKNIKAA